MLAYAQLFTKAYRRNLHYRVAHLVNNVASALFGFIYIAIWQAAGGEGGTGAYDGKALAQYVAFNQALLWITIFQTVGLGIPESVRTGAIGLEMLRPVDFHLHVLARSAGNLWYNLWYRSIPLATVFALAVGLPPSLDLAGYGLLALSIALAAYIGLSLHYLSGISSFWTLKSVWAHQALHTLHFGLSGFLVPVDLLPGGLAAVSAWLPFAALQYYPARIYLGISGAEALIAPLIWAALLTLLCRLSTRAARARLEVQGG